MLGTEGGGGGRQGRTALRRPWCELAPPGSGSLTPGEPRAPTRVTGCIPSPSSAPRQLQPSGAARAGEHCSLCTSPSLQPPYPHSCKDEVSCKVSCKEEEDASSRHAARDTPCLQPPYPHSSLWVCLLPILHQCDLTQYLIFHRLLSSPKTQWTFFSSSPYQVLVSGCFTALIQEGDTLPSLVHFWEPLPSPGEGDQAVNWERDCPPGELSRCDLKRPSFKMKKKKKKKKIRL